MNKINFESLKTIIKIFVFFSFWHLICSRYSAYSNTSEKNLISSGTKPKNMTNKHQQNYKQLSQHNVKQTKVKTLLVVRNCSKSTAVNSTIDVNELSV